jgi:RimJ/RimL family protein N-acetyltransferase
MELQPLLNGNLVRLRPLEAADFERLYEVASDPLVWEQHPENTRYRRDVFEGFFAKAIQSGGAFAILDAAAGSTIIGSSRYYEWNAEVKTVFIGFTFLARQYWGGDYNREIKHLMLAHAFKYVDRVFFEVGLCNVRSQKAMLKIGAEKVEVRENSVIFGISKNRGQ